MMLCRKLRGVRELAMPPWNLLGLLVRKFCKLLKNQIPLGSVRAVAFKSMRSRAKPNLMGCAPRLRRASSYAGKAFEFQKAVGRPPTPPGIAESPPAVPHAAPRPADAP